VINEVLLFAMNYPLRCASLRAAIAPT
jgi:hypothetical protein